MLMGVVLVSIWLVNFLQTESPLKNPAYTPEILCLYYIAHANLY